MKPITHKKPPKGKKQKSLLVSVCVSVTLILLKKLYDYDFLFFNVSLSFLLK